MEIRAYYKKLHEIEQTISDDYVIVVSLRTGEGGVEGRRTEVGRSAAARLLADGAARLASPEEAQEFRREREMARDEAVRRAEASRVQVTILRDGESRPPRPAKRG
jgi:hypothetical protein